MIWPFKTRSPEEKGRTYLDGYLVKKEKLDFTLREHITFGTGGLGIQRTMEALYHRTYERIENKCGSNSPLLRELKGNAPYWMSEKQD